VGFEGSLEAKREWYAGEKRTSKKNPTTVGLLVAIADLPPRAEKKKEVTVG